MTDGVNGAVVVATGMLNAIDDDADRDAVVTAGNPNRDDESYVEFGNDGGVP